MARETKKPATLPEGLTEAEQRVLDLQRDGLCTTKNKGPSTVFAYATTVDRVILVLGCLSSIIGGALNPLLTVIFSQLVGSFDDFNNGKIDGSQLKSEVARYSLYFVYLAIGLFVFIYTATVIFFICGERITQRLRLDFLKAVLRQNMAYYDVLGLGLVTSSLTSDAHLVQEAISGKVSLTLTAAATCVTAFIITFAEYWKLALVLLSTAVAMTIANTMGTRLAVRYNKRALDASAKGNAIAEEALRSHRHVAAFGIHEDLASKYAHYLRLARAQSLKARYAIAMMIAAFMGVMYLSSGLAFWQGSRFLVQGEMNVASIVACSMAIIIAARAIRNVAPNAHAFVTGIAGAGRLLECIKRQSPQDPFDASGTQPCEVRGELALRSVRLAYPSRADTLALNGLDVIFPAGKMTAVIGASGCGKSSIIGLVERFYMPISGSITLDGVDIQTLNLQWLRQQVSLVSQEPVLFKASIFDNICHGLVGGSKREYSSAETRQLVIQAAKDANAHDFIEALPHGYDTEVGEMGAQLSGGQRQRIAIARAIVRNPRILLLDEATAALDTRSERLVMEALERVSVGRTTVFITHRLSSIRKADQIVVMSQGRVVEVGTHDALATTGGIYSAALEKQKISVQHWDPDDMDGSQACSTIAVTPGQLNSEPPMASEKQLEAGEHEITVTEPVVVLEKQYSFWSLVRLASKLGRPELPLVSIGLVCCLLSGAVNPVQSLFFAHSIDSLSLPPSRYDFLRSQANFWSLMYLMLGIVAFVTWTGQGTCLAYCSEALTYRARHNAFRSMLRQDAAFFDRPKHSTGALMSVLSTSATQLAGLGGAVLSAILTAFATLAGGIILSLVVGWKLGLVCTATVPVVLGCGWLRLRALSAMDATVRALEADSTASATEAITAVRTVSALCLEEHVLQAYRSAAAQAAAKTLGPTLYASALYAASQSAVHLVAALAFWYGGTLMADEGYTMVQYFICFAALVSGSQSIGAIFSFAPDMSKARHGGQDFKRLFDETPAIDVWNDKGLELQGCRGAIELQNVSFSYPNRPGSYVLKDFSLQVQPGQTVALVGPSGCGKSTTVSLLERFFDPTSGIVCVDGVDLRKLNLTKYRALVSLVGQEPVLYQGTIQENLVLGVGRDGVSQGEIEDACREANILEFIHSLPSGFHTEVGSRGTMLSGGQRQRIAIARALLRNSPILLLDEATSALDGDSEAAVQQALDAASRNRTTVTVAHRLRTVRNANLICVLEQGSLVEQGTHEQLMRLRGKYAELVELQSLEEAGGPALETLEE